MLNSNDLEFNCFVLLFLFFFLSQFTGIEVIESHRMWLIDLLNEKYNEIHGCMSFEDIIKYIFTSIEPTGPHETTWNQQQLISSSRWTKSDKMHGKRIAQPMISYDKFIRYCFV